MRIDTLFTSNVYTQGARRRAWLFQHSPQHIQQSTALMLHALTLRPAATSSSIVVLGAGACTEVPIAELARATANDELVLVDLDHAAMEQGRNEIASPTLRKHVRLVEADITGGVSANLNNLIELCSWHKLIAQGARAVFDAAAECLEQCIVSDRPEIANVGSGFGVVISSLVLSQLFSYPLLDVLDYVQRIAPQMIGEQERHRRYQDAAQAFRIRVISAHLHLLRSLLDRGGIVVLLSDIRGYVFDVYGTDHDAQHRRTMPLVPRTLPDMVREHFTVVEERNWEWLSDLPEKERLGRGYEVVGYILQAHEQTHAHKDQTPSIFNKFGLRD
ncbi:MAG TPA: hypothetical protein VKR42_12305 [Ktedonobacteraceae bacterium]|nr:hypothetical protein [Ktedonobacteraceae bacterium]